MFMMSLSDTIDASSRYFENNLNINNIFFLEIGKSNTPFRA